MFSTHSYLFFLHCVSLCRAIIVFRSQWECDLDKALSSCTPNVQVDFLSNSFNFRRAEFQEGLWSNRQLIKMYGLRIIFILTGQAGKFDVAALFTQIGAGIGLLAVAGLVADFAAVNVLGHRYARAEACKREILISC
jgi:hypothetical protein